MPNDALNRGFFADRGFTLAFGAFTPDGAPTPDGLERMLLGRTRNADVCLLVVDRAWEYLAEHVRNACFAVVYDAREVEGNYQNFFHRTMKRFLRSFGSLAAIFDNADDRQLLSLPIRNFDAAELRELVRICREENTDGQFTNAMQEQLAGLRRQRRPRRRSDFRTIYAVDSVGRFFSYGKEKHARLATSAPHRSSCEFNGHFRFGCRIDEERHYNVSETEGDITVVEGQFLDCHGDVRTENGDRSHLNMFSNDFF